MATEWPLLTPWAQRSSIFLKALTSTSYFLAFTGITQAPFEPLKDTNLKHLTLKTALLLALVSGKSHSEIHAWVANKVYLIEANGKS